MTLFSTRHGIEERDGPEELVLVTGILLTNKGPDALYLHISLFRHIYINLRG